MESQTLKFKAISLIKFYTFIVYVINEVFWVTECVII